MRGAHAVKELVLFHHVWRAGALNHLFHDFPGVLVVARKHTAHHHEIRTTAQGLAQIAGARDPTIADDVFVHAVGRISAVHDARQLGHPDPRFQSRRARTPRTNPALDHIHVAF